MSAMKKQIISMIPAFKYLQEMKSFALPNRTRCHILYNNLLFQNGSKASIAHFPNRHPAKVHCACTTTYNGCTPAKENMDPFICQEWTKQVALNTSNVCMCPFLGFRGTSSTKAMHKQEVRRISQWAASQGAHKESANLYLPYWLGLNGLYSPLTLDYE